MSFMFCILFKAAMVNILSQERVKARICPSGVDRAKQWGVSFLTHIYEIVA